MGLKTEILIQSVKKLTDRLGHGSKAEIGRATGLSPVAIGKISRGEVNPGLNTWELLHEAYPNDIPPPQYEYLGRILNLHAPPAEQIEIASEKLNQSPLIPYVSEYGQVSEYAGLDLWEIPIFDTSIGEPSSWSDNGYPIGFPSEYVAILKKDLDPNSFAVRCHGDSMVPTLYEGDTAVVVPSAELINGKLCFATWWQDERGDRLVKRYRKQGDTILLESDNKDYDPIILTPENGKGVKIFRVTKLLRDI